MDGGAWWAAVHGVAKSQIRLRDFPFTFHFHALKKEMATHSSVLAWRIPGTGEPSELPSMGSHRVGHDWGDLAAAANTSHVTQRRGRLPLFGLGSWRSQCWVWHSVTLLVFPSWWQKTRIVWSLHLTQQHSKSRKNIPHHWPLSSFTWEEKLSQRPPLKHH